MDDMAQSSAQPKSAAVSRRRFLSAFLTLAAFLHLTRKATASELDQNETVLSGGWLLKRSDLR